MDSALQTERLTLRAWRNEDIDAYAALCADPQVMRYLGGKPFSRLEAWRHMAFLVGHWSLRGYGHWALEEKASGELIGRAGFINPDGYPGFELGWVLARAAWGKGYATEVARYLLPYAFMQLEQTEVISLITPGNQRSVRVAEKIGEVFVRNTEVMGAQVRVYGIDKSTWLKNTRQASDS